MYSSKPVYQQLWLQLWPGPMCTSILCILALGQLVGVYVYALTALYGVGECELPSSSKILQTEIEFHTDVTSFVSWSLPVAAERERERERERE